MKSIIAILSVVIIFSTIISCSSDVIQSNPCDGYNEVPSKIRFTELNDLIDLVVDNDTMVVNSLFRISIDAPNYKNKQFILSGDTKLYNDSSTFSMRTTYSNIRVIAYLSGYKDSLCNKNYKKHDTIIRNLSIIPWEETKLNGEYWGCNLNNLKDSFMIRIKALPVVPNIPNSQKEIRIFNLNKGCFASSLGVDTLGNMNSSYLSTYFFNNTFSITDSRQRVIIVDDNYKSIDNCSKPEGYGFLNKSGDLEIHYNVLRYGLIFPQPNSLDSLQARDTLIYIGRRIR